MKRIISAILILTFLVCSCFAAPYDDGYLAGQEKAEKEYNGTGWVVGGFCGGFLLGLIGVAGTYLISATSDPSVDMRSISDQSNEYKMGYKRGYQDYIKNRNSNTGLISSIVGLGVFLVVYVATVSNTIKSIK